jgi:hypothetical protein
LNTRLSGTQSCSEFHRGEHLLRVAGIELDPRLSTP